jgi:hypothetical protein
MNGIRCEGIVRRKAVNEEGEEMPRELIADTQYYKLEVDGAKNRTHSEYKGFWPDTEEFKSTYVRDMQRLLSRVRPGYTTIVDLREFKVPPQTVIETVIKVQEMLKKAGLKRSARITDQPILKMTADRIGREAEVKDDVRSFNTILEAEVWLDS